MKRNEVVDLISKDVLDKKIIEPRFSGIMHIEIFCGEGSIREIQIQPEPERLKYVHASPPDPLSGRAYREG
jgi:hypothetical protein